MEWEGPDALEQRKTIVTTTRKSVTPAPQLQARRKTIVAVEVEQRRPKPRQTKRDQGTSDDTESSDDGSEDEYIAEETGKRKTKARGKVRVCAEVMT